MSAELQSNLEHSLHDVLTAELRLQYQVAAELGPPALVKTVLCPQGIILGLLAGVKKTGSPQWSLDFEFHPIDRIEKVQGALEDHLSSLGIPEVGHQDKYIHTWI